MSFQLVTSQKNFFRNHDNIEVSRQLSKFCNNLIDFSAYSLTKFFYLISPDEESDLGIEQFAFGVLCQTVIKKDSKSHLQCVIIDHQMRMPNVSYFF